MTTEQRFTRLLMVVFALNGVSLLLITLGAVLELPPAVPWVGLTFCWMAVAVLLWGIRRPKRRPGGGS